MLVDGPQCRYETGLQALLFTESVILSSFQMAPAKEMPSEEL